MMKHFAQDVEGYFTESDFEFYKMIVEQTPFLSHFVEVGAWKGRSTSFMAVEIINSNKQIRFDVVDTFIGSEEMMGDIDAINGTLFETFQRNMLPVNGYYNVLQMDSLKAAERYRDGSLDFVFIDASHDYDSVTADIKAWLPKIKSGGIISGHDYPHGPVYEAVNHQLTAVNHYGACWYKNI